MRCVCPRRFDCVRQFLPRNWCTCTSSCFSRRKTVFLYVVVFLCVFKPFAPHGPRGALSSVRHRPKSNSRKRVQDERHTAAWSLFLVALSMSLLRIFPSSSPRLAVCGAVPFNVQTVGCRILHVLFRCLYIVQGFDAMTACKPQRGALCFASRVSWHRIQDGTTTFWGCV